MTGAGKSRWADDEDAALEAQRKKEKEKKRLKAEKARKLEVARQEREGEAVQRQRDQAQDHQGANGPPSKRRRLSQDHETAPDTATPANGSNTGNSSKLLRFEGGAFGRCRSVENYDKLNDIEEGAYGWVARAKELSAGKIVALKRLKLDPKDRSGLPVTGLREIQILKDCNHRNVVKLREVVVGEDTSKIEKYEARPIIHQRPSRTN